MGCGVVGPGHEPRPPISDVSVLVEESSVEEFESDEPVLPEQPASPSIRTTEDIIRSDLGVFIV